ncbi:MAG: KH domain-containing protein [Clostridia bacterium]|nr:KH domain-containing protein [Clostridia bacterium]
MKELLSYIVSHLVSDQDAVRIETVEAGDTVTLQLRVAPDDMGKVIGRQGRIAKEIRTLIKSAGQREDKKIMVDILD